MPRPKKKSLCPECGGQPELWENTDSAENPLFHVYCSECGFEDTKIVGTRWDNQRCVAVEYETVTEAVNAWNEICTAAE